jgi:hypothetical protein
MELTKEEKKTVLYKRVIGFAFDLNPEKFYRQAKSDKELIEQVEAIYKASLEVLSAD